MTTATTGKRRVPARTLKSPLAVPGYGIQPDITANAYGSAGNATERVRLSEREETLAEFEGYLRTVNNRDGRPTKRRRSASTWDRPNT